MPQIERALVITAHPDDVDFGAAGTVATWTDAGIEVSYCIVTSGDAGPRPDDVSPNAVVALRKAEQTAAATRVGVSDVTFLGYPDGIVTASLDLRRDLSREIRRVRPQRVLTQSPERFWQRIVASHPDHLATGEAAVCAVYPDAQNPHVFTELLDEGFEPWVVNELWIMAAAQADHYVDITEVIDRKIDALLCHASQIADPDALRERIREWTAFNAAQAEFPEGHYAEAFAALSTVLP